MISGDTGYCRRMSEHGYDEDVLIEYLFTLDAITGIETSETDDAIVFSFRLDNESCPLLVFRESGCTTNPEGIRKFLSIHGHLPFEAEDFFTDVGEENGIVPIPLESEDCDPIILAVYRLMRVLNYHGQ